MLRLERRCPDWLLRRFTKVSYTAGEATPRRYELVEEVDPPSVDGDGGGGEDGSAAEGAAPGGRRLNAAGMLSGNQRQLVEMLMREMHAQGGAGGAAEQERTGRMSNIVNI